MVQIGSIPDVRYLGQLAGETAEEHRRRVDAQARQIIQDTLRGWVDALPRVLDPFSPASVHRLCVDRPHVVTTVPRGLTVGLRPGAWVELEALVAASLEVVVPQQARLLDGRLGDVVLPLLEAGEGRGPDLAPSHPRLKGRVSLGPLPDARFVPATSLGEKLRGLLQRAPGWVGALLLAGPALLLIFAQLAPPVAALWLLGWGASLGLILRQEQGRQRAQAEAEARRALAAEARLRARAVAHVHQVALERWGIERTFDWQRALCSRWGA